jgi:hypothetical protein
MRGNGADWGKPEVANDSEFQTFKKPVSQTPTRKHTALTMYQAGF